MSTPVVANPEVPRKHRPYVPETMEMKEFTFRAVLIGLFLTALLGSANAYLGLKAGMTIAATYPAAVISMALLRLMKGSLLEENIARTVGSIGESVAAGAIFTIPAFVMAGLWPGLTSDQYWKSVALMMIGGTLGILFVTLLRRVMVEDPDLPFPESVAASEIHKAGQQGAKAAKILFANMGFGAFMYLLGAVNVFNPSNTFPVRISALGKRLLLRTSTNPNVATTITGGATLMTAPDISPAYLGVGYIIGPRLAALNFAGGVLAWGVLVPLLTFTIGPYVQASMPEGQTIAWPLLAQAIYFSIVRPIAVGGMLVGASYTLFKMRKQLALGMGRAVSDLKKSAAVHAATNRTERDLPAKAIFAGIVVVFIAMIVLYHFFIAGAGTLSSSQVLTGSLVAAVVMIVVGFFFAAVSGNLVGMIGSSNNPVSGDCGAADGGIGCLWNGRRGSGVGGGGCGVCFIGGGGRDAAGPEGRTHFGRHAVKDADWRSSRHRRSIARSVLPDRDSGEGISLWQSGAPGSAGGVDGHVVEGNCWRRHGVAAGDRRHPPGIGDDSDRGEERDAVRGWHVSAAGNDLRDFCGRSNSLAHRQTARPPRLERCSEGASRKCGRAHGVWSDRG
jgi:OPT oligopeptide transporter protein